MSEYLQWAAIVGLALFVAFARGSAVTEARRLLAEYDRRSADEVARVD